MQSSSRYNMTYTSCVFIDFGKQILLHGINVFLHQLVDRGSVPRTSCVAPSCLSSSHSTISILKLAALFPSPSSSRSMLPTGRDSLWVTMSTIFWMAASRSTKWSLRATILTSYSAGTMASLPVVPHWDNIPSWQHCDEFALRRGAFAGLPTICQRWSSNQGPNSAGHVSCQISSMRSFVHP